VCGDFIMCELRSDHDLAERILSDAVNLAGKRRSISENPSQSPRNDVLFTYFTSGCGQVGLFESPEPASARGGQVDRKGPSGLSPVFGPILFQLLGSGFGGHIEPGGRQNTARTLTLGSAARLAFPHTRHRIIGGRMWPSRRVRCNIPSKLLPNSTSEGRDIAGFHSERSTSSISGNQTSVGISRWQLFAPGGLPNARILEHGWSEHTCGCSGSPDDALQ